MKTIITTLLFSCAVSAGVPANSVTITDLGTGQTNRVFVISRVFAQGEIRGYPKPQISGVTVSEWQADNKTAWPDGSVAHSIISFKESLTASQTKTVAFVSSPDRCHSGNSAACDSASLDEAGMLAFNGSDWDFEFEVTADPAGSTTMESVNARTMVDAAAFEYWLRGPVITEVLVGRTSRTWDFAWDCSANCTGTMSTATWNDGSNQTLHPWFILSFHSGASGVRGQYIMENIWTDALQDQRYDVVLKSGGALETTEFSKTDVVQYDKTRWRKEYWSGAAPAGYDETDGQGGRLGYTQNPGLQYLSYSRVIPRMDFTRTANDISADTAVSTGSCYMHEPLGISNCSSKSGGYSLSFGNTGGRPELGLFPRWFINYLYSGSNDAYRNLMRQADISGLVPIHFREASTTKLYEDLNNDGTADGELAFARPLSINPRPTMWTTDATQGSVDDRVTELEPSSSTGWSVDQAHQAAFATIPYLVTGNYYFLEEIQFWSSVNIGWGNPSNTGLTYGRHGTWGVSGWEATRSQAWCFVRAITHAAFFSPANTPEKRYYTQKMENNIKVFEGLMDVRDGIGFDSETTSPYNANTDPSRFWWGRHVKALDSKNGQLGMWPRWILCSALDGGGTYINLSNANQCDAGYMMHYMRAAVNHASELIADWSPLARKLNRDYVAQIRDPKFSIYFIEAYMIPLAPLKNEVTITGAINSSSSSIPVSSVPWYLDNARAPYVVQIGSEYIRICSQSGLNIIPCGTAEHTGRGWISSAPSSHSSGAAVKVFPYWQSLESYRQGFSSSFQADTSWDSSNFQEGYAVQARATASWLEGFTKTGFSGDGAHQTVRDAMQAARPESSLNNDPRWAFKPRWEPVRVLGTQAGDDFAIIRYIKPTAEEACTYNGESDGVTNSRYVEYVKSELTAATPYNHEIVCAKDPYGSTPVAFTTLTALSGTVDYTIRVGSGSATVFIDHGVTSGLGSELSASCASGCTVTLPGVAKGVYYYRIRRSTGETSAIQAVVVR